MEYTVAPMVLGLLGYVFISYLVKSSGRTLKSKFDRLGDPVGKTRGEIEAVVGSAGTTSLQAEGKVLLQWMATGFHIALLMKDDKCEAVTHRHSQV